MISFSWINSENFSLGLTVNQIVDSYICLISSDETYDIEN